MNTNQTTRHLDSDELARAAVDPSDLAPDRRHHLMDCTVCVQQLTQFQDRMARLGRAAERMAPASPRPFRLPVKQEATPMHWLIKPAWAVGAAVAMILAILVLTPQWRPTDSPRGTALTAAADRQLMEEIDALVDNALPVEYQQLALLSEPVGIDESDSDADFLDWIAPSIEDEDGEESIL